MILCAADIGLSISYYVAFLFCRLFAAHLITDSRGESKSQSYWA